MNEVALFSTCLAEEFFPEAPVAAATVLERLRLRVRPVRSAFCCGLPAFSQGFRAEARELARRFLDSCVPGTPVVALSGACVAMVRLHYRDLFADDPGLSARAEALRPWMFEFSQFLVGVLKVKYVGARFERTVAYQPACHLRRDLGGREEARLLLSAVSGIRIVELNDREECCGFGGPFSLKFPELSGAMLEDKLAALRVSGAEVVVSADCGCLMQLAGGLHRAGDRIETRHLAEVLAAR